MISAICSKNSSIVNSIYNCRKKVFEADIEYKRIFREILKDFNFDEKKCTSEEFNDKFSEIEKAVRNEAKEKGFEWLADTFYFYNYKLNNSARREKHDFLDINRFTYFHDFSNCMNSVRHLESISDNKEFLSIVKSLYFMVRNDMLSDAMEAVTKQYREDNSKYLVDTLNFNKKIKKLENKVSKYESIIDESKTQNKNLKAELARVSSHVRTLENTIESYSGDNVKELNSIVDTLKQKVEKYKQDSEELKSVITELKEKREKKESENLQLLSKIDKLEKEVDRLNNLNNSLSESKGIESRNKYSIDIKLLLKALSEYKIAIVGGDYIHSYFNEYNNIFPCSNNGTKYLQNKYPRVAEKIKTSYLGTIDHGINPIYSDTIFHIISCSRVEPVKRINKIVDALEILDTKNIQIEWTHIGGGTELNRIKYLCQNKIKHIKCHFKGNLNNVDVIHLYQKNKYDLFINVSSSEGLPVSIMEAISFGIPVIATDVGGSSEIVINKVTGQLIEKDFAASKLAKILEEYINKDLKNLKKSCRSFWRATFQADIQYNKLQEYIRKYIMESKDDSRKNCFTQKVD